MAGQPGMNASTTGAAAAAYTADLPGYSWFPIVGSCLNSAALAPRTSPAHRPNGRSARPPAPKPFVCAALANGASCRAGKAPQAMTYRTGWGSAVGIWAPFRRHGVRLADDAGPSGGRTSVPQRLPTAPPPAPRSGSGGIGRQRRGQDDSRWQWAHFGDPLGSEPGSG